MATVRKNYETYFDRPAPIRFTTLDEIERDIIAEIRVEYDKYTHEEYTK